MSNLTPMVRPDKNGKMVTRHVKTEPSHGQKNMGIPSPQTGTYLDPVLRAKRLQACRNLLGKIVTVITNSERPHLIRPMKDISAELRSAPDDLAELFADTRDSINGPLEKSMLCALVVKCVDARIKTEDIKSAVDYFGKSDENVRDKIDEYFFVGAREFPNYPIGNYLNALQAYELNGFDFDRNSSTVDQDPWTVKQCDALRKLHLAGDEVECAVEKLFAFDNDGTIREKRLAQLAVDQPDSIDDIVELMIERETTDYDLISSVLSSEAGAIREGVL